MGLGKPHPTPTQTILKPSCPVAETRCCWRTAKKYKKFDKLMLHRTKHIAPKNITKISPRKYKKLYN